MADGETNVNKNTSVPSNSSIGGTSGKKNSAKGAADKAEDATRNVAQTTQGMDAGDDKSNDVNSNMAQGFNDFLDNVDQAKNLYNNAKKLRKGINNSKGIKDGLNGLKGSGNRIGLGDQGPASALSGDTAGKGNALKAKKGGSKAGAEGAKQGGKAAGKVAGKAITTAVKGLVKGIIEFFASPAGWITLAVIAVIFAGILIWGAVKNQEDTSIKKGEYSTEYYGKKNEDIKNTWQGVFYQTYSDRSVWAQVDTTSIEKGDADICPDSHNGTYPQTVGGETGVDACSGQSYEDLTGVKLSDIDTKNLYQEGTKQWSGLRIEDIGSKENYLALSAGTLSVLDRNLNEKKFLYPEQFIKPVYASCIADVVNSADKENTAIDFDKCKIQNTDNKGNPQEIEPEDQREKEGINEFDDPSLYLTYAKSTGFNSVNVLNAAVSAAQASQTSPSATPEPYKPSDHADDDGLITVKSSDQVYGQWDYGLGTLAHYKAVFQPSRITNYTVRKTEYICDGNGNTSSGVKLAACEGAKFGDVVVDNSPDTNTLTQAYSVAYIPNSELYYRDWFPYSETFNKDPNNQGATYYSITSGEYPNMGIPRSQWVEEPGVSTGIPQTEVKYVIDKAVTMGGVVTFNVSQKWVTQAPASHVQTIHTELENKRLARADQPFPDLGGANKNEVSNYTIISSLYYKGSVAPGYQQNVPVGYKLTWVAPKREIKQSILHPEYSKKKAQAAGEYYTYKVYDPKKKKNRTAYATVPPHYEDASGHVYWGGASHGLKSSNSVLSQVPTGENPEDYYWGAKVEADITVEKEGDLQTYIAQYNSEQPAFADQSNMAYLNQYLTNYRTYVKESSTDTDLSCYKSTVNNHSEDDLNDFQKMKDLRASTSLKSYKYNLKEGKVVNNGLVDQFDEANDVCLSEDKSPAVTSLYLNNVPEGQFSAMAGRMGFSKDDPKADEDIVPVANKLKADVGQSTDNNLSTTLSSTDQAGNTVADIVYTYSSQYGVDPTLLSLIIAEQNSQNSNITGIQAGTYKAYNISSRARTTTEMGGGSQSKQKVSILSYGINIWNKIKKILNINQGGTVAEKGLETITVSQAQLENGAMLTAGSSSLQTVTDPSIFQNSTITTDQKETASKIYTLLKAKGFTDEAVAGVLGNANQESRVSTYAMEPGESYPNYSTDQAIAKLNEKNKTREYTGIGLLQWTDNPKKGYKRATNLLNYAKSQNKDWKAVELQIGFLFYEPTISGYGQLQTAINEVQNCTDVDQATKTWLAKWEGGGTDHLAARQAFAHNWYSQIKSGALGNGTSTDPTTSFTANTSVESTIQNINNSDYHWDPSDPRYGTSPTESGATLSSVYSDTDKKLSTIVIYPMMKKGNGWYPGAVVTTGDGLLPRVMLMVSSGTPYTDRVVDINDSDIYTNWVQTGNGYTPMGIHLSGDLWLQSMPYTSQSRDSLRTNPTSYQHLIDQTPMEKESFYLQLKDVIYLASHASSSTQIKISSEPYTNAVPDAITEASTNTISTARIRSQPGNISGTLIATFTPQALSTKVAAMQLQTLEVKYDYNIPMVITAYGMGSDFMDKVLDVYYQQTGIDRDTAIENKEDTAWADYRAEVYNNLSKYNVTLPDDSKPYDYAEKVLSRLGAANITYQRVDLRYNKTTEQVEQMTEIENKQNDSQQHTIGTWSVQNIYDSIAQSNTSLSGNSAARVARAMRLLNKESGKDYITATQWNYITNGQLDLPGAKYNYKNPDQYWDDMSAYIQVFNNIRTQSEREEIISQILRFGTDEKIGENDYSSQAFMNTMIAKMFGNVSNVWSSTMSVKELFGDSKDPINYAPPTKAGATLIRKFGYVTDSYGLRKYRAYATYQDLTSQSADVYGCLAGKVAYVDQDEDGYYVAIDVDTKSSNHTVQMQYTRLSKAFVSAGDKIVLSTIVGKTNDQGVYGVGLIVDDEPVDFDSIRTQLVQQANPTGSDPVASISSVQALEEYAKNWATNHISDPIWAQAIAASQGGRNFQIGRTYQCTDFAHWVFWMQYGTDWSGGGNGNQCAGNIVRTFGINGKRTPNGYYFTDSKTPTAGSIFSWDENYYGHVGYVSKVEGDSIYICDGNVNYAGKNRTNTPNYFYPIKTSGIRINMKFSLSDWTGQHPSVHYAVPHKG